MQMYGNFQNLPIELNPSLVQLVLHYLSFLRSWLLGEKS